MAAAAVSSAVTEQLDTLATLPVAYDGTLGELPTS
jgi:hypothetical protein